MEAKAFRRRVSVRKLALFALHDSLPARTLPHFQRPETLPCHHAHQRDPKLTPKRPQRWGALRGRFGVVSGALWGRFGVVSGSFRGWFGVAKKCGPTFEAPRVSMWRTELLPQDRVCTKVVMQQHLSWKASIRAFLNLWFAKLMVCMRVTFHEMTEIMKTTRTTQTATNKELSVGLAEITETHGNDRNHGNPRKRNTGSPNSRPRDTVSESVSEIQPEPGAHKGVSAGGMESLLNPQNCRTKKIFILEKGTSSISPPSSGMHQTLVQISDLILGRFSRVATRAAIVLIDGA